ncbi:hypothetical protein MRX96_038385 [Rhipicephalus microplus]
MNAERLSGTLFNSGSETGDQMRRGFDSVQQCAKVLKGFRLPIDADVPLWFEEVEKLFATYQVPHESRVHLVMPALTERVRYLLRNLNPEESADYESVKAAVLTELKLSPAEYLQRFERAVKRKEETWAQFASRVKTYFSYYLQVREADTVEVMAELMVADHIKSGLSTEGLEYVRLREGEGWFRPTEIAKVLQTFEQAKGKGRASKQPTVEMGQKPATRVEKGALKCHLCHGSDHFAKECPKAIDKENNPKKATEPKRKVQKSVLKRSIGADASCLGLMKRDADNVSFFLNSLGQLHSLGVKLDPSPLYPPVPLPVPRGTPSIGHLVSWDHSQQWKVAKWNDFPTWAQSNSLVRLTEGAVRYLVNIMRASGDFEICEGGTVVASGTIRVVDDNERILDIDSLPSQTDQLTYELHSEDIYKELRLRGYEYGGPFQGHTQV